MTILSMGEYPGNAALISAAAKLGYLRPEWPTLEPTWGYGSFWTEFRPQVLVGCDLNPKKSPIGFSVDFTNMPFADRTFTCVVFDPPFKLNGRSDLEMDERYGVDAAATWQERFALTRRGITECERVLGDGYFLLKAQDQVCSGKKRWATIEFTKHAETLGLGLVDQLHMKSYRGQPKDRRQVHSHQNFSSLLVFKRGWRTSDLP